MRNSVISKMNLKIILMICVLKLVVETDTKQIKNKNDAMNYLDRFGYMPEHVRNSTMMAKGIEMFQKYAGLPPTGRFDKGTMRKMNMPRCGNKEDMNIVRNGGRNIRSTGWKHLDIYYKIRTFPVLGISPKNVKKYVREAFQFWEEVADITAFELESSDPQEAEIEISFVSGPHGDNAKFGNNEIGKVVAHAFGPESGPDFAGDVHFDNDKKWSGDGDWSLVENDGINFRQICAHEIGHALGLHHTMDEKSVMHMLVKSRYDPDFKLHSDDIQGIQKLYGPNPTRRPVSSTSKWPESSWDWNRPMKTQPSSRNNVFRPQYYSQPNYVAVLPIARTLAQYRSYCFQLLSYDRYQKAALECFKNYAIHHNLFF